MRNLEISSSSALRALRKPFGEFAKCLACYFSTTVVFKVFLSFSEADSRPAGAKVQLSSATYGVWKSQKSHFKNSRNQLDFQTYLWYFCRLFRHSIIGWSNRKWSIHFSDLGSLSKRKSLDDRLLKKAFKVGDREIGSLLTLLKSKLKLRIIVSSFSGGGDNP